MKTYIYKCLSVFITVFFSAFTSLSSVAYAAPPSADDFGTLPLIHDAALSPNGEQIALIINFNGDYGLRLFNVSDMSKPLHTVKLSGSTKPEWVKWANNRDILISIWGNEIVGKGSKVSAASNIKGTGIPVTYGFLYSIDTHTKDSRILVRPHNIFRQYNNVIVDFLDRDPDHILMAFSDTNVGRPDVKKVNVRTGKYTNIKGGQKNIQSWITDRSGTPRLGEGLVESSQKTAKYNGIINNLKTGKWENISNYPGLDARMSFYGFAANPQELIVGRYNGRDTLGIYIYDLDQKRFVRDLFHHDKYDARGLIYDNDSGDPIGASFTSESNETELFGDYDTNFDKIRAKHPGYTVDFIDQASKGNLVIYKISNAYDPGTMMLHDFSSGQGFAVSFINPKLKSEKMGETIAVRYTARDEFKIPAYVTIPPTITDTSKLKDLPFIILPHGGPYARDNGRFDYFSQFFASRGYGVLQMNFRGSIGYGKAYEEAGRTNWDLMQEDVEDGARWLISKGYADPNRMCIAGWSYGGYAALMGSVRTPELYKCSISIAGVTDLNDLVSDIKKYSFGSLAARNTVLEGFDTKKDLRQSSPLRRVKDMTVPVFLAHGEHDQRVHHDQFKRMEKALRSNKVPHITRSYKEEDHFLSNEDNRKDMFRYLDKFLETYIGKSEHAP